MESIIKQIKTWMSPNADGTTTVNVSAVVQSGVEYKIMTTLAREVVDRISDVFLKENEEAIKRDILQNPEFANAVYNAIVLKKSDKI